MGLKPPPVVRFGNVRSNSEQAALVKRAVGDALAMSGDVGPGSAAAVRELIAQNIERQLRNRSRRR